MELKSLGKQIIELISPYFMEPEKEKALESGKKNKVAEKSISKESKTTSVLAALFNGMGVGLLMGLLLGLAVSPVVSGFIGTLSSVLILLIGLNEKFFSVAKSVRIGAFGIFTVVGILLGFYVRSHSPLAPSLLDLKVELDSLGYSEKEVRDFIAYQEFQLIPEGWVGRIDIKSSQDNSMKNGDVTAKDNQQSQSGAQVQLARRNNILFSSEVNAGQCFMLESSNKNMSLVDIQLNYEAAGGSWKALAFGLDDKLPEEVRINVLLVARDVICATGTADKVTLNCNIFNEASDESSAEQILKLANTSNGPWGNILSQINTEIDSVYHKTIYLSLINIFCHEKN